MDKEHDYRIVDMGAWRVKGQNVNAKFERKMNARFVLGVSELVEKHFFPNILTHFQHKKKLQFSSKKSILSWTTTSILIPNNNL